MIITLTDTNAGRVEMSLQLSVYTKEAYGEYLLPPLNNADHTIVLYKDFYALSNNITLGLEVKNHEWVLRPSDDYHLSAAPKDTKEIPVADGGVLRIKTTANEDITIFVQNKPIVLAAYKKYKLNNKDKILIGRNHDNNICFNNNNMTSALHAVLIRQADHWVIENHSGNGIYVNSSFVDAKCDVSFGDFINIVGLHIVFLGDVLAVDDRFYNTEINLDVIASADISGEVGISALNIPNISDTKYQFHRSPRHIGKLNTGVISIEEPPVIQQGQKQPLLMTIGPSFTMALPMLLGCVMMMIASRASGSNMGLFMYSGLVMAGSSAVLGIMWALINIRYQKTKEAESETHRFEAYSQYLIQKTENIKRAYDENKSTLENMYPATDVCVSYTHSTPSLWDRNATHDDFLNFRLGVGNVDFQMQIEVPKEKFTLEEDGLREKPAVIRENFRTLYGVPITIDLGKNRMTGIISNDNHGGAIDIARVLAAQIAANCCYTDVKMVFLYNEDNSADKGNWGFAKWFPHTWSEDKKIRYVASNKRESSDICFELAKIFRKREEDSETIGKKALPHPYFVLFISDLDMIRNELVSKYLLDVKEEYGLSVIILADAYEQLPNNCSYVIENDDAYEGVYSLMENEAGKTKIDFDKISLSEIDIFARRLSNIEVMETETGGEIPNVLTFFEMYKAHKLDDFEVMDRWLKNRTYDHISGMLGQKAGGEACFLDVHEKYHGPHGLVAGTTGSGKSETLQTYLLSLAINYSPDDVGFFIIDYKGGGMANLFNGLPHMIGQISNLSGNQVNRAMVSIKSENQRRQRIFNASGVNNINSYTKLYKNNEVTEPIPHLFIIIDEFAELKKEEPDFMRELISVAQVGRSLGVHLILATQKPSGTVDDNIWSNSKFRLCLRVQDRQDSMDMLHKPDAAYITQAGRGYLQVGNDEVYDLFQSGWSGAPFVEDETGHSVIASLVSITGKATSIGKTSQDARKKAAQKEWISAFVKCVLDAQSATGTTLKREILDSRTETQGLLDIIYKRLKTQGIDYPKNRYNTERLVDFMGLYIGATEMGATSIDGLTDLVIRTAEAGSVKLPQEKEKSQLEAVKDYLSHVASENGYSRQHALWLPVLSEKIYLDEFSEYKNRRYEGTGWTNERGEWQLDVVLGKIDDPQNQSQFPLIVSYPDCGHLAVIGSIVSGKSTFLQTFVYSLVTVYSPDFINIYALDFSSKMMAAFEGYPQVGGIMYDDDMERIRRFFSMLEKMEDERKAQFHGGNFSQYVKSHVASYPAILIIIDNFSAFNEKTEQKYLDEIIRLSKEGVNLGIFLAISANAIGMNDLPHRIAENMTTMFTLELPDKFAYADILHTMKIDVLPEVGVKGRGLCKVGTRILEYQTCLSFEAPDDFTRMEQITAEGAKLNKLWTGRKVKVIPYIPEKPVWTEFEQMPETKTALASKNLIPVGYDNNNAEVYSLNLRNIYCYLISGAPRTGRKNFMKILINAASLKKINTCLIDLDNAGFTTVGTLPHVTWIQTYEQLLNYCKNILTPLFTERNAYKHQLQGNGLDEDEIFEKMSSQEPLIICITNLEVFIDTIYRSTDSMGGFFENLFSKGALHNIYFFGIMNVQNRATLGINAAFKYFSADQYGIHFGGNVSASVLNFDYIPFATQSKVTSVGMGMIAEKNGFHDTDKVIIPLANRAIPREEK